MFQKSTNKRTLMLNVHQRMKRSKRNVSYSRLLIIFLVSIPLLSLLGLWYTCQTIWGIHRQSDLTNPTSNLFMNRNNLLTSQDQAATYSEPKACDSESHPKGKSLSNHTSEGFSACLLIKDDNHFLIEWLAYHYTILPLRRLIIATDPSSETSPQSIIDRWNATAATELPFPLEISLWGKELDYFPLEGEKLRLGVKFFGDPVEYEKEIHYSRQRHFYAKCLQVLRQEERSWTVLIDTDEFLFYNPRSQGAYSIAPYRKDQTILSTIQTASSIGIKSKTYSDDALSNCDNLQALATLLSENPCIMFPRLLFGTKSSTTQEISKSVPLNFNPMDFLTMRWRWHTKVSSRQVRENGFPKGMIDLQRLSKDYPLEAESTVEVHEPIKKYCHARGVLSSKSFFVAHHYVGSWEQFSFRNDIRRTKQAWEEKYYENGQDDTLRPWLEAFVQKVGESKAKELLEGVGLVQRLGS